MADRRETAAPGSCRPADAPAATVASRAPPPPTPKGAASHGPLDPTRAGSRTLERARAPVLRALVARRAAARRARRLLRSVPVRGCRPCRRRRRRGARRGPDLRPRLEAHAAEEAAHVALW